MAKSRLIQFHSEDIDFALENEKEVAGWLQNVISSENRQLLHLNFVFCSDDHLLQINQTYLNHDYYTDVITFPLSDGEEIEGDIFISVDRIKENASKIGVSVKNELLRVMVHGVLHLVGYQDKTDQEKSEMTNMENIYLSIAPK